MSASPERHGTLVISVNWLGDAVMCLPALAARRAAFPDERLDLATKPKLTAFWSMCDLVDRVHQLPSGGAEGRQALAALRAERYAQVILLPNSLRSGWQAWRSGIPRRRGTRLHGRGWLINDPVDLSDLSDAHQSLESARLLEVEGCELSPPRLAPPQISHHAADEPVSRWLMLLPGAARGPSKQWPEERWEELIERLLTADPGAFILLGGTPDEKELCERLAGDRERVRSMAGHTSLPDFAGVLAACDAVVANDSGGMHLATAVGVPVVAVYGITDPAKTGPLGDASVVIQHSEQRCRDIPRESPEAEAALRAVSAEEVAAAVQRFRPQ